MAEKQPSHTEKAISPSVYHTLHPVDAKHQSTLTGQSKLSPTFVHDQGCIQVLDSISILLPFNIMLLHFLALSKTDAYLTHMGSTCRKWKESEGGEADLKIILLTVVLHHQIYQCDLYCIQYGHEVYVVYGVMCAVISTHLKMCQQGVYNVGLKCWL